MFKSMLKVRLFYVFLIMGVFLPNTILADCGAFTQVPDSPFSTEPLSLFLALSPEINGKFFAAVSHGVGNSSVSAYSVDGSTGAFTPVVGSPFATGFTPTSIAYSPIVNDKLFAAVVNASAVSAYTVNMSSGAFTLVGGSPFAAGTNPQSVAYSPVVNGNLFAAVANGSGDDVSVYSVNTTTGAFSTVDGSPFTAGNFTSSVAYSAVINGSLFAAVTNLVDANISVFSVDPLTGAFVQAGSPVPTEVAPRSVAYSPVVNGNLFAAVAASGGTSVYSVNTVTGVFTPLDGPAIGGGESVAYSPIINGQLFAAISSGFGNTVSVYSVDTSSGIFTQLPDSPFTVGAFPNTVAYSPIVNGNIFAVVTNSGDDNISVYSVDTAVPAATLSVSSEVIAQGNSATLTATLTGTAPFTITYSDGFVQDGDSPLERVVSPTSTTDYQIVSVSDSGDHCNPGGPSNTVTVTVVNSRKVVLCGRACRVARTGRPRICGRAKPGSQVKLFANKKCVGSAKANCRGVFCIVPRKALSKGCNSVVACVRDEGTTSCSNVIRVFVKRR